MDDLKSWFEIAKYIGAGGAFVLGIVAFLLWKAYQKELDYSKTRDRETLNVLAVLVSGDSNLMKTVEEVRDLIRRHLEKDK